LSFLRNKISLTRTGVGNEVTGKCRICFPGTRLTDKPRGRDEKIQSQFGSVVTEHTQDDSFASYTHCNFMYSNFICLDHTKNERTDLQTDRTNVKLCLTSLQVKHHVYSSSLRRICPLPHRIQTVSRAHPSSYAKGNGSTFPGGKAAGM
jgi:hypothetical protein